MSNSSLFVALDGVVVDRLNSKVTKDGKNLRLTLREFQILNFLINAAPITMSRREIMNNVWDLEGDEEVTTRTIDVHIRRIRKIFLKNYMERIIVTDYESHGYFIPTKYLQDDKT